MVRISKNDGNHMFAHYDNFSAHLMAGIDHTSKIIIQCLCLQSPIDEQLVYQINWYKLQITMGVT